MKTLRTASTTLCWLLALILGLSILPTLAVAADPRPIVGDWEGTLDPGAQPKKRIVVHITTVAGDGTLEGTIDYPDQDTSGIQITAITYKQPTLHFESTPSVTVFDGVMNKDNSITGTLKISGASLSLVLKRTP